MARHRNVRNMRYEDELASSLDEYGKSYDDMDHYACSPATEEMFMYNRGEPKHTLSTFMEEPEIQEESEEESDDNDDTLADSTSNFKMPDLDDRSTAKLQSALEHLEGILGDYYHKPTAVAALLRLDFDAEKALDEILNKAGRQTLSTGGQKTTAKKDYTSENKDRRFSNESGKGFTTDVPLACLTLNHDMQSNKSMFLDPQEQKSKAYQRSTSLPTSPNPRDKAPSYQNDEQSKAMSDDSAPSSVNSTPVAKRRAKARDAVNVEEEYKKRQDGKDLLNLIVIGHVDAGKSTLMGHVLYRLGNISKKIMHKNEMESKKAGKGSFAYAWVLDETEEERTRGITMDVAMTTFETTTKSITLMDAPGHRDFIPNMIQGTAQADVAILVVDASVGEFESGFEQGGQTREHALLARSLGVNQMIVAVNKMDNVAWSKVRYDDIVGKLKSFLKQAGFRDSDVTYIPCSGLTGENLIEEAHDPGLVAWYKGTYLTKQIDKFKPPERPIDRPFRLCVGDVYKGQGGGFVVAGKVESGSVQNSDKVLLMPAAEQGSVKALSIKDSPVKWAAAGDHATMTVTGIDMAHVSVGSILCDTVSPIRVTSRINARVVVFNVELPIIKGFMVIFHCQSLTETATITKLISTLNKNTGEVAQRRPRFLPKHSNALIEIKTARPICAELFKDNKVLGRFMLRYGGKTIAAGVVTEIK